MRNLESGLFACSPHLTWETVGEGVRRQILTWADSLMLVKVAFETGGVGGLHQHVHVQQTYIESGVFAVTIDGQEQVLRAGEGFNVPSNLWHGVVCLEAGMLLDAFSPLRQDFLK
jgi:quercetin dioxygenase-like cupin family protein